MARAVALCVLFAVSAEHGPSCGKGHHRVKLVKHRCVTGRHSAPPTASSGHSKGVLGRLAKLLRTPDLP